MGLFDITGLGGITDVLKELIQLFPNAEQREKAANKIQDVQLAIAQGQMAIDEKEAESSSMFVAGWRPFIGWTCGVGFVYAMIIQPVLAWFALMLGVSPPPVAEMTVLMTTLGGMLGLGTMRTVEKINNVPATVIKKR